MRNERIYYLIRLIAGAYIIYLAVDTLKRAAAGEIESHGTLLVALAIVILAAGAGFIVWGLMGLKKAGGRSRQAEKEPEEGQPEEAESISEESSAGEDSEDNIREQAETAEDDPDCGENRE